jgi:hypothetical protein
MGEQVVLGDLGVEREVELRVLWVRLRAGWWLVVVGLVVGAAGGLLLGVGGQTWRARTLLYLGQPFTTSGGGQIQSLATNPQTVSGIVSSGSALKHAAEVSGLPVGQLRVHVTSTAETSGGAGAGATQVQSMSSSLLAGIVVEGPARFKVERAADALAASVIAQVSTYVDRKIRLLDHQITASRTELKAVNQRVTRYTQQLQGLTRNKAISPTDRLIAIGTLDSSIGFAEQRRGTVQQRLFQNLELLSLARNVERSKILQPAAAAQVTAKSPRNAAAVGALIGLLLGAVAAYLGIPRRPRRNRQALA